MSSKLDAIRRRVERGARVKAVRDALDVSQDVFADMLTQRLAHYGVAGNYNRSKISRLEGGERNLTVDEAAIVLELDPQQRPGTWLVFGGAGEAPIVEASALTARSSVRPSARRDAPARGRRDRAANE